MKNLTNKIRSKMFDTKPIMCLVSDKIWHMVWMNVEHPVARQTNTGIWHNIERILRNELK